MKKYLLTILTVLLCSFTASAQQDLTTKYVTNPSFEGGTYNCDNGTGNGDLNAPEGWTVTYTNADWGWKNFRAVSDGNQQDGSQYFEFWGATYHTIDLRQEVKRLPAGTYCLSAAMRTEKADQVTNQHIYVKVGGREIPSDVLGAPKGSAWNAVDAWHTLTVTFTLYAESDVVIGATSTGGAGSAGWFQIDNFRLDRAWSFDEATGHLWVNYDDFGYYPGYYPWHDVRELIRSVELSPNVTSIGHYAFSSCSRLASITIPEGVTSIGTYAFEVCGSLMAITIPEGVTSIEEYAFDGCENLKLVINCSNLTLQQGSSSYGYVGYYADRVINVDEVIDGYVFDTQDGVHYLAGYIGDETELTLPDDYQGESYQIGDYAFYGCRSLTSITIPEDVTSIGDYAFYNCSNLKLVINYSDLILERGSSSYGYVGRYADRVINIDEVIDGYAFDTQDGVHYLTGYIGDETRLTLPDDYQGESYQIGTDAFRRYSSLTSIIIPDGVTSIGRFAFEYCGSLTTITLPEGVTSIEYGAFDYCSSLTAVYISSIEAWCKITFESYNSNPLYYAHNLYLNGELVTKLVISEGVTSIGDYAFKGCSSLTSITLPEGVTSIGYQAFLNCSSLTAITIPEGVTSIGRDAFYNCRSLTSITIPEDVTSIGNEAFYNCGNLKLVINYSDLTLQRGSSSYGYVGYYADRVINIDEVIDGYAFDTQDGVHYLTDYMGDETELTLPDDYQGESYQIASEAFSGCGSLTSITIPEGVTSIGEGAFKGCKFIRIVMRATNPPSILSVDNEFNTSILLVPSIALSAYKNSNWGRYCKNIYSLEEFNNPSFELGTYNCDNGTGNGELYAPLGWQVTYTNANWGWKNFRPVRDDKGQDGNQYFEFWADTYHTLDLSQEVYDLPAGSYVLCAAMRTERADQVTNQHIYVKIGDKIYKSATLGAPTIGCAWDAVDAWQTLRVEFTMDSNSDVVIGATSTGGADSKGFFQIDNFRLGAAVSDIHLSQRSATIKDGDTLSLVATIVPSNTIDKTVAWNSSDNSIATVDDNGEVIAKGVGTAIITAAVGGKSATCVVTVEKLPVTSMTLSKTCATLAEDESITLTATISPDNATYRTVTWSSSNEEVAVVSNGEVTAKSAGVATIAATADGITATCEVNVKGWKFDNATGHLLVNDVIEHERSYGYPWYEISEGVLSVEFGDLATAIGKQAFATCASLMTVTMSDSVKSIGDEAFYECIGLMNVDFSNNLEYIGDYAFTRCAGLMSVAMNDSVKSIGDHAFTECIGLMSVEFSNNLESIGDYAFAKCVGLTSIDIPNSISNIKNYAFTDCDGLINVFIPSSVTNIGNGAFADCDGLSSIVIPSSVITIGSNTFLNCDGLTSIVIPNSVKTIGGSAFQGCSMLNKLVVGNGVGIIGVSAFEGCEKLKTVINLSNLDIVKGATTHGHVAYYADIVMTDELLLDLATLNLTAGESAMLTAIMASGDNNAVTWSSSNENVAVVNKGEVTAIAAGIATITATINGKTATCVVTVEQKIIAVSGITLSQTEATLVEGGALTLVATLSPDDATDKTVTWSTSDATIATVDNGVVTAVAAGTATITATAGNYSATCTVTVSKKEIPVTGIELNQTSATIIIGNTLSLEAIVTPFDATNQTVTWSSSNTSVATVDENGVVTAVAAGTATITAKAGDKSAACVVTVTKKEEPLPSVASGEYYLYHADSKRFLSRGEHWGTCATVDRYGIPFVWTAEEYSLKFLDSNVHLFETDDSNIYTDNNSTGFAFEAVEGGYLLKSKKSDRYLTIVTAAITHDIVNVTDDASAAVVWQLKSKAEHDAIVAGYVKENYANVIKAAGLTATAGGFVSYLSTLTATDMTSSIATARFNGSAGDWTFTEVRHQDWQPAYGTDFCELWQATGSYTQTITGLAEGIYKVTVQGFERSGGWAECNALAEKGYEISTATLSANGEETNLKSWYSGKTDSNNPDNTGQAVAKFNEGKYMNEVYTYVGADGTLTLTVCKPSHVGGNWIVFNNFTLTRYAEGGTGVGQLTIDNGQLTIYDLMGRKVENPAKGIYIVGGKKTVVR